MVKKFVVKFCTAFDSIGIHAAAAMIPCVYALNKFSLDNDDDNDGTADGTHSTFITINSRAHSPKTARIHTPMEMEINVCIRGHSTFHFSIKP